MGWKTSIIIASQVERPNLARGFRHDADIADRVAAALPGNFTFGSTSSFEEGAYPRNGNLYVGATDDSLIIGHAGFTGSCFTGDVPPVVTAIDALMPHSAILALELHSVVNLYGYALFEENRLVRGRAGSADDGVFLDIGEPVPEEQLLFETSIINADGEQVWLDEFDGVTEEMDHSCMGEEFVFEISRRFFGERFDCFDHETLSMSEYQPAPKSIWERLFGR